MPTQKQPNLDSRVKYPLTNATKNAAQYLFRCWDSNKIEQGFTLMETGESGEKRRNERRLSNGYGVLNDDFESPSLENLKELALFRLLDLDVTYAGNPQRPTPNWHILLLQELRNAVENDFQVSDYFLTFNAVGTIILGNPTISAPFQSGASIYGNVSQEISSSELAQQLTEILGNELIQSNAELSAAIYELTNSIESERQSKLGKVVSELGRGLQHGANAYVVAQAIGFIGQVLR